MRPQDKARQLRPYIEKAATSLDNTDAPKAVELFKRWKPDTNYIEDDRVQYSEKLYRVRQNHKSQADWTPDIATSLYEEVALPGQGDTPDNPIPYSGNMKLVKGKYYSQNDVTYICTRDTGIPVYDNLANLVGLYVEVWVG